MGSAFLGVNDSRVDDNGGAEEDEGDGGDNQKNSTWSCWESGPAFSIGVAGECGLKCEHHWCSIYYAPGLMWSYKWRWMTRSASVVTVESFDGENRRRLPFMRIFQRI